MSTILKYHDLIDFSKIADVDIIAFRYLLLNLLTLSNDRKFKQLEKEKENGR
ncbi:MAG: hypothetical protein KBS35_03225 [Mycoplasma sp.]|nr:hypothetical protein [Candidatus Hennigella equi]